MSSLRIRSSVLASFALPFIVLVVSPLVFYFGNHSEFEFGFTDVFPYICLNFGVAWLAGALILLISATRRKIHAVTLGVFVGLAGSAWLQSQIMVWNIGLLDGRGLDWSQWKVHGMLELLVWAALTTSSVFLAYRKPRIIPSICRGILAAGVLSTLSSYFTSGYESKETENGGYEELFQFHPVENTLLILLDTFQLDLFLEILDQHEQDVEFLEGFVFYRNTVGVFPTTYPALPAILTGEIYRNEKPIKDFVRSSLQEHSVTRYFDEIGYTSHVVVPALPLINGLEIQNGYSTSMGAVVDTASGSLISPAAIIIDGGLFRAVPTFLKERIYSGGDWFLTNSLKEKDLPPSWHGIDIRFLRLFLRSAKISSEAEGSFKFYHFATPHPPIRVNENLDYLPDAIETRETVIAQSRGALTITRRILNRLKDMGIYDSARIVILADHGTLTMPVSVNGKIVSEGTSPTPLKPIVHSSGLPLLLIKEPGGKGEVSISDAPIHLTDLPFILTAGHGGRSDSDDPTLRDPDSDRSRSYFFYNWTAEFHSFAKEYMPPFDEYSITGHALDPLSWTDTRTRYDSENRVTKRSPPRIEVDTLISMSDVERSQPYLLEGWAGAEPNHRWTAGRWAGLWFELPDSARSGIKFRVEARGLLVPDRIDRQTVEVIANGSKIATWEVSENAWHDALISRNLCQDGQILIELHISDPSSPSDYSNSTDNRKLGLMVRSFQVVEK